MTVAINEQTWSAAALTRVAAFLLFVLGVLPFANWLSNGQAVPWFRHALTFWILVGGSLLLVLTISSRVSADALERLLARMTTALMSPPWWAFVGLCALLAFCLCAWIATYCFGRQPHSADEAAQLFHARVLLQGRLSIAPDPNAEFFQMDAVIDRARWYSQFPIGGPAFLAVGLATGAAWLLNPLLLALSIVCTAAFARRVYGDATSRAVALLFALCPFALFMSASFMNHVPVMLLTSAALWQLARWAQAITSRDALIAASLLGFSIGVAFTVRPVDALAVALTIAVVQLAAVRRVPGAGKSLMLQVVAGCVPACALLLANTATTGAPTTLGYEILYGNAHQLGFHADPYGTVHTPLRALLYAGKYLMQLNVLLFEWPLPALGVLVAGLAVNKRPQRWDAALAGVLVMQVLAYALYWHEGVFRGPRFLFTAMPAIVVLIARAPFTVAARWPGRIALVARLALPLCVAVAWLAYGINDSAWGRIRQYRSAAAVTRIDPDSLARAAGLHNALVFINEGEEGRNLHRLWSLGLSRGDAARLMVSAPACAVRRAIDGEEAIAPPRESGRRDRLIRASLGFAQQGMNDCTDDTQLDAEGTASYVPFFPANQVSGTGALDGDVIYALDLGARNEVLRARFGSRTWYRFGARARDGIPRLRAY